MHGETLKTGNRTFSSIKGDKMFDYRSNITF